MTDRMRGPLILSFLLAGLALLFALQPYSVISRWSRYDEPGRRYVEAALRSDTTALQKLSASPQAVSWALRVGQSERRALTAWANSARASVAFRRADTVDVWYETATDACPFRLTFAGQQGTRVVRAHARCYMKSGWPDDPSAIQISR